MHILICTLEYRKEKRAMEKQCCEIKVSKTDNGFAINVSGIDLKDLSSCCVPIICKSDKNDNSCCDTEKEK